MSGNGYVSLSVAGLMVFLRCATSDRVKLLLYFNHAYTCTARFNVFVSSQGDTLYNLAEAYGTPGGVSGLVILNPNLNVSEYTYPDATLCVVCSASSNTKS
jgi:hypothetical protein